MRVLVVEDDVQLGPALHRALTNSQMSVDLATTGEDALTALALNEYSVVVVDRSLPGTSGDQVCKYVVANWPGTKILMVTGMATVSDRVEGLALGADDYLTKPFDLSELIARIRALDRRSGHSSGAILTGAGVRLDPNTEAVSRFGSRVRLTHKEFEVLQVLLKAGGDVVSVEQLVERAWDENADPSSRSLRVIIGRIRDKLGEPEAIATVVGSGYRMNLDEESATEPPAASSDDAHEVGSAQFAEYLERMNHEMRGPITLQRILADIIAQENSDDERLVELASQIKGLVDMQRRHLDGLVTIERWNVGAVRFTTVDLDQIVTDLVVVNTDEAKLRGITITSSIADGVAIEGDRPSLDVLVGNAIRNAIRHNIRDGHIDVTLVEDGDSVVLKISNSGPVVRQDALDGGNGLSIIRQVCAMHGVKPIFECPDSGGVILTIVFPLASD